MRSLMEERKNTNNSNNSSEHNRCAAAGTHNSSSNSSSNNTSSNLTNTNAGSNRFSGTSICSNNKGSDRAHITTTPEADHAAHFEQFLTRFCEEFAPLKIFSFSRRSQLRTVQSCFYTSQATFYCDYCLLVITDSATGVDYEMQDFANTYYEQGSITVLCHSSGSVRTAVQHNHRFFISVLRDAQLLYNKEGFLTCERVPKFVPTEAAEEATKHAEHRMALAENLLSGASECLTNERHAMAVFMLYQVVEQGCIGLIAVHIGYQTEFHHLRGLLQLCQSFSARPLEIFLSTDEDKRLFDLMVQSYFNMRYDDQLIVSQQGAEGLYLRTSSFLSLCDTLCTEKIEQLDQEADLYDAEGIR